jgi:hypothetical protein
MPWFIDGNENKCLKKHGDAINKWATQRHSQHWVENTERRQQKTQHRNLQR